MVGQRIGNYQIVQPLGEGGMATVYLALHPELGRRVAVKVMNPDLARSGEMVQRFFNEARAASGIGHRGIVEVSDLGTLESGAPYIVMELLEGESLADRLTRTGRLPLASAAELAGQAADVMVVAHARGIVHRDLKPENLFLVADPLLPGRELVKVLDFGIAKLSQRPPDGGGLRTRTGAILGTPRYMSPEQCRESRDVDHRADVYSLGVVLYEMLAGAPPFASSSWGELAHMHIGVEPPALQAHASDIPAPVAEVVHRALEKDPAARFQSMTEFKGALEAATGATGATRAVLPAAVHGPKLLQGQGQAGSTKRFGEPALAPTPAGRRRPTTLEEAAAEVVREPRRPRRVVPLAVALSVAAVVVAGGWWALRPTATTGLPTVPAAAPVAPPAPTVRLAPPVPPPPPAPVAPAQPAAEGPPDAPTDRPAADGGPAGTPDQAPPVRRRRRSIAPGKPSSPGHRAAPAPLPPRPRPQEPTKI